MSAAPGDSYHIWRQRFSDSGLPAVPEQITSGATGEEGIAVAPDGRSLITAVGLEQSSVWVHDSAGERRVSLEGVATSPKFSPDGKTLYYRVEKNNLLELWVSDLGTGRTEPLLPSFPLAREYSGGFDISPDGRRVVVAGLDSQGKRRLWIAAVDRRSPPRPIPNAEVDGPLFMPDGEILFRAREGAYGLPYRVWEDGTSLRKAIDYPVINMGSLSPDGQWVWVYSRYTRPGENPAGAGVALPLSGRRPVRVFGPSFASWSGDRRFLFVSPEQSDRTYLIPIRIGRAWPPIPEGGFRSEEELAKLPGVRVIDTPNARPGPSADVYAFSRETVQRNLYRIPLP